MSATHNTGQIVGTRQGSSPVIHTIVIGPTGASGVPKKVLTVDGSSQRPGFFRCIGGAVMIPSDATTHTIAVGSNSASYNNLVAAATDIKAAAGTSIPPVAGGLFLAVAPLDIYVIPTYTGTPTVGASVVFIEVWDVNAAPNTTQGD